MAKSKVVQAWTILGLLLAVQGCSCDWPGPPKAPAEDLTITKDGHEYLFPAELVYNHTVWRRTGMSPTSNSSLMVGDYISEDGAQRLQFFQMTPGDFSTWILFIYGDGVSRKKYEIARSLSVGQDGTGIESISGEQYLMGPQRLFYANGVLKFEGDVFLAIRHGESKGYYPSGKLWWTGRFEGGAFQHEGSEFFDEEGNKITNLTWNEIEEQVRVWNKTQVPIIEMSPQEYAALVDAT